MFQGTKGVIFYLLGLLIFHTGYGQPHQQDEKINRVSRPIIIHSLSPHHDPDDNRHCRRIQRDNRKIRNCFQNYTQNDGRRYPGSINRNRCRPIPLPAPFRSRQQALALCPLTCRWNFQGVYDPNPDYFFQCYDQRLRRYENMSPGFYFPGMPRKPVYNPLPRPVPRACGPGEKLVYTREYPSGICVPINPPTPPVPQPELIDCERSRDLSPEELAMGHLIANLGSKDLEVVTNNGQQFIAPKMTMRQLTLREDQYIEFSIRLGKDLVETIALDGSYPAKILCKPIGSQ